MPGERPHSGVKYTLNIEGPKSKISSCGQYRMEDNMTNVTLPALIVDGVDYGGGCRAHLDTTIEKRRVIYTFQIKCYACGNV